MMTTKKKARLLEFFREKVAKGELPYEQDMAVEPYQPSAKGCAVQQARAAGLLPLESADDWDVVDALVDANDSEAPGHFLAVAEKVLGGAS